ncbi:GEM-like protein 4 [Vitis vinifera]|uniref:GEM-like protein 4 n=1 Tax=Vitis vinifera TaxID=29760 RepID=A0A438K595_VITVI|nr:GEM-like protein 4 [Vitis vinifera]
MHLHSPGPHQSLRGRILLSTCCRPPARPSGREALNCRLRYEESSCRTRHWNSSLVLEDFSISPFANGSVIQIADKVDRKKNVMNNHGEKVDNFMHGIREHVKIGPKISDTVKGKLTLGARILQLGGVKRVFKKIFSVIEGEKLLNASQSYLSTTAGPIAGLLFISTQRVSIPLRKIRRVEQSENMKNPSQKYMEIVTVDNFEFWFMGFLNYQKAFNCLQQALFLS